jgi:hypothetical protein
MANAIAEIRQMNTPTTYTRFSSVNSQLGFSFLYPSDWQMREAGGTGYDEVSIIGPRNHDDTYSLGLNVRVTPVGQQFSLDRILSNYLNKRRRYRNFREIFQARGRLIGAEAIEAETSHTMPLPINTLHPKETPIVERRIFLYRGGNLYEIMYQAVEEDYDEYLDVFKNVLQTFQFRDDTARRVYRHRPLVAPRAAQVVREEPSEYKSDP